MRYDARMRESWVVLLLAGALACAEGSVCEQAADKLEACEVGRVVAEQGYARLPLAISRDDCSGTNECLAQCVSPASCEDITYALKGGSTDPNTPPASGGPQFLACVDACAQ
jgi:hypothetical protein